MGNTATIAFVAAMAALSSLSAMNNLMRSHPVVASIAALELTLGPLFIYIGFNTHIIL